MLNGTIHHLQLVHKGVLPSDGGEARDTIERMFQESRHRTNQFSNYFSHVGADTVENWLQVLAFARN